MTGPNIVGFIDAVKVLFPECSDNVHPDCFELGSTPEPWILVGVDCATCRSHKEMPLPDDKQRCDYLLFVEPEGSPLWLVAIEEKSGRSRPSTSDVARQLQGCADALQIISNRADQLLSPAASRHFQSQLNHMNARAVLVTKSSRTVGNKGKRRSREDVVNFPLVYRNKKQAFIRLRPKDDLWSVLKDDKQPVGRQDSAMA